LSQGKVALVDEPEKKQTLIERFAEEISSLKGNPKCSTCYGKFYTGIAELPNGVKVLQTCRCAKIGETEYIRLQSRIDATGAALANQVEKSLKEMEERLSRRTLVGFVTYLWKWVKGEKKKTKWPVGVTSDGKVQFAVDGKPMRSANYVNGEISERSK